jgi:SAM-dependent methyltransferase
MVMVGSFGSAHCARAHNARQMSAPVSDFYDDLASSYHLIFEDWDRTIARQGEALTGLIHAQWPGHRSVLDVCCGIGTQSMALAQRGFVVTGSDLSQAAIDRAKTEAAARGLDIRLSVCDMRQASAHHGTGFDLVVSCDNALPHLLTDQDIAAALGQMYQCLRPGGGCLLTVRDYDREPRGRNLYKPLAVANRNGRRTVVFQVWDFDADGEHYDFTMYFVEDDLSTRQVRSWASRSRYYAIGTDRLLALMQQAGFERTGRIDGLLHQPVLIGTRPG